MTFLGQSATSADAPKSWLFHSPNALLGPSSHHQLAPTPRRVAHVVGRRARRRALAMARDPARALLAHERGFVPGRVRRLPQVVTRPWRAGAGGKPRALAPARARDPPSTPFGRRRRRRRRRRRTAAAADTHSCSPATARSRLASASCPARTAEGTPPRSCSRGSAAAISATPPGAHRPTDTIRTRTTRRSSTTTGRSVRGTTAVTATTRLLVKSLRSRASSPPEDTRVNPW